MRENATAPAGPLFGATLADVGLFLPLGEAGDDGAVGGVVMVTVNSARNSSFMMAEPPRLVSGVEARRLLDLDKRFAIENQPDLEVAATETEVMVEDGRPTI